MENYLGIAFIIYIIGLICCYVYEGWKNGYGNTSDDNYFWPLFWPVLVSGVIIVIILGIPIAIVVFGFKFIFDTFIFIGNILHELAKRTRKKSSTGKSRWVK